MSGRVKGILPGVVGYVGLWCCLAIAQEAAPPAETSSSTAAEVEPSISGPPAGTIREAKPSLWYMKDPKDGTLKPVMGWTPEELEELAQIKLGLKQRDHLPRFSLQSMSAFGVARGSYAELKVELRVLVRDDQGVRVPLRLNQALIRGGVEYQGSGEQFLVFEEGSDGYVSYIRGGAGEVHHLKLDVLAPLALVGNETRFKLTAPRATSCEVKLKVPIENAVARVSESVTLLPSSAVPEGGTELTVLGNGGDVELSWRKQDDPPAEMPTVLEAIGEVQARADGRTIQWEARISVKGYGSPMDRFRIRLPKGSEFVPTGTNSYTVSPVANESSPGTPAAPLVEVQLSKKTSGPEEIRLAARLAHEVGTSSEPVDLAGFEVVDAARQWGHIAVSVAGDWHVRCEASAHVRQVDAMPEWLRSEGLVAGFEYFRQPYSLMARVVPRQTRISVEPEHLLLVESNQVRLETKLKYTVRGAKVFRLSVELPQWQLEEVGPDNLVNLDGVEIDKKSGLLTIPLAQPSIGQMEVTIRASLPVDGRQGSLPLELPRPQAGLVGPAALVVLPADNVELTPNAESTQGLVRQQVEVAPEIKRPKWQQAPLFYRAEGSKAIFATDFRVRSQEISAAISSRAAVDRKTAEVEQKIAYTISYEPADRLVLDLPGELAAAGRVLVLLKDQALSLTDIDSQAGAESQGDRVRKSVGLPEPCIGACELTVRYSVELRAPSSSAVAVSRIPLVMPDAADITANTLFLAAADGIRLQHREGPWRLWEDTLSTAPRSEGLRLSTTQRADEVTFAIQFEDNRRAGSTVVSRAWVQTWLMGTSRQDRAVFRFASSESHIQVVLPAGVNPDEEVEIFLDGKPVAQHPTPFGRLVVPLTSSSGTSLHQLDLSYHCRAVRPGPGSVRLELPRLGENVWTRRMYWELVLPGNEHLLAAPPGLTPEIRWNWNGALWCRAPSLDQAALEDWVGAQPAAPLPTGANRYLFSSLGAAGQGEFRTATRSLVVLTLSGVALVAGLLLIYIPAMRHPAMLLAIVVALTGAALVHPGPSLLAAQAASLGVVLTLLAGLLQRTFHRKRAGAPAVERGSSMLFEKGSSQVPHRTLPADDRAAPDMVSTATHAPVSDSHA